MPDVRGSIDFLANSPIYHVEKPYYVLPSVDEMRDVDPGLLSNMRYDAHEVAITDIRGSHGYNLGTAGFQMVRHTSKNLTITDKESLRKYKDETEELLRKEFPEALYVHCYDYLRRENRPILRSSFDANDPLLIEGPAKGAHNATFHSGPAIIERHMPVEARKQYLKPGYRYRIINTWRPTISEVEDSPLAFCDSQTIDPSDLIPADRVFANQVGEVYYIRHNANQKWHWISRQTPEDVLLMLTFDTKSGANARYCAHVAFKNPLCPVDAPMRESCETRSILISRE